MRTTLFNLMTVVIILFSSTCCFAQPPNLGTAESFALFTSSGSLSNTGSSAITGDAGTNNGMFLGFLPAMVTGTMYESDATTAQATSDVTAAYAALNGTTCGSTIGGGLGNNQLLTANVYCIDGPAILSGNLILDGLGNNASVFIFKVDGNLTTGNLSSVTLINGASACNVYWQVNGNTEVGVNSCFSGTILGSGSIAFLDSASLQGRALTTEGSIALENNILTVNFQPEASVIQPNGPITCLCPGTLVVLSGNVGGIWNTGSALSSISVTTGGDYYVVNTTSCGSVTSNHIVVEYDTTGPVLVGTLADYSLQCLSDTLLLVQPDLEFTDACNNVLGTQQYSTHNGGAGAHYTSLVASGPGTDWAILLPELYSQGFSGSSEFIFDGPAYFETYISDGTGHLWGHLVNTNNPNQGFDAEFWLHTCADWPGWEAQGRSYKDDLDIAGTNYIDWKYYELADGFSQLSGTGDLSGSTLYLGHYPTTYYYGFQCGVAANNRNASDGMSGWFNYTGNINGASVAGNGDLSINREPLNFTSECGTDFVTWMWLATDNCGNVTIVDQTITIQDTIGPVFENCPADITAQCNQDIPEPQAIADFVITDNCGIVISPDSIVYVQLLVLDEPCNKHYIRRWTAHDECFNYSDCVQNIYIHDTIAPTFSFIPADYSASCEEQLVYEEAIASDNCQENIPVSTVVTTQPGNCPQSYIIHRQFIATDSCSNSVMADQWITVTDLIAPVFVSFEPYISVDCTLFAEMPMLAATDNCSEVVYTHTDLCVSGGCIGVIIRNTTASDLCGNTSLATQYITILDTTPPVILNPANLTAECSNVPSMPEVTAEDGCNLGTLCNYNNTVTITSESNIIAGDCENNYTIVWHWHAIDYCENASDAYTYVTVQDTTNPVFVVATLPADLNIECSSVVPATELPIATDNCDNDVLVLVTESTQPGTCPGEYVLARTFTAIDNCGNQAQYIQNIYIVDTTAPVFTSVAPNTTMECNTGVPAGFATATDNCSANVVISWSDSTTLSTPCLSTIVRTYTACDDCGNCATASQTIQVIDTTAPVITGVYELNRPCDDFAGIYIEATDNCNTYTISSSNVEVSGACQGRFIRTYVVVDACGNSASFEQIITLIDTTSPAVVPVDDFSVECGSDYFIPTPVFTDNCDIELTYTSGDSSVVAECQTFITYWWTATDNCENSTYTEFVVTIEDTTDPVFTDVPAAGIVSCESEFVFGNPTAIDICDNDVTITFTDTTIPGDCPQSYSVVRTWIATDDCQNTAMATSTYQVVDNTAPVFTSVANDAIIECNTALPAGFAAATDNCDEVVSITWIDSPLGENPCSNTVIRTYTACDDCGNCAAATQTIQVIDTTAPVITGVYELNRPCNDYAGIYVEATDNCNTYTIDFSDVEVSGACQGRYLRTYVVTDFCGNSSSFEQIITLIDTTNPVVETLPVDLDLLCDQSIPLFVPMWSDNCDTSLELTMTEDQTNDGCTQVITQCWTATDNCDNATTICRVITITDTIAPVWFSENQTFEVNCGSLPVYDLPVVTDNCDDELSIMTDTTIVPGPCSAEYTELITWTAYDNCGNMGSIQYSILYSDSIDPFFVTVPASGMYECDEVLPSELASAADLCTSASVTHADVYVYNGCLYDYTLTRTWTATDECGNSAMATTVYSVYDNTSPIFDISIDDVIVNCVEEIPVMPTVTASDNCGFVLVTVENTVLTSDSCGNQITLVCCTAADECGNLSTMCFTINVEDTIAPTFNQSVSNLVIDCQDALPQADFISANDNCSSAIAVVYTETLIGDVPLENALPLYTASTPDIAMATNCQLAYDNTSWSLFLGGMPVEYHYYTTTVGRFQAYDDGTAHLQLTLQNANNSNAGFTADVWFENGMSWNVWATQFFPTSFKADCGAIGSNHIDWEYYIMTEGSTLTGWGDYSGSILNIVHAPANNYFGFQVGLGANNMTAGYGGGGWFSYSGIISDSSTETTSVYSGAGDFSVVLESCPEYYAVREWCATDCSGNSVCQYQTITFADLDGQNFIPSLETIVDLSLVKDDFTITQIMPNPAMNQTVVNFVSKTSEKLIMNVYDMSGRQVAQLYNAEVVAGINYTVPFDTALLESGLYNISLNSVSQVNMKRLLITH